VDYQLGRFCAQRSKAFHGLTHLPFTLASTIAAHLTAEGVPITHPLFSDDSVDGELPDAGDIVLQVMRDDAFTKRLWNIWQETVDHGTNWVSGRHDDVS
jgi:hypothetical protein